LTKGVSALLERPGKVSEWIDGVVEIGLRLAIPFVRRDRGGMGDDGKAKCAGEVILSVPT
jgi:hypothetical protein